MTEYSLLSKIEGLYDQVNPYIAMGSMKKKLLTKDVLVFSDESNYSSLDINIKNKVTRRKTIILR